MEYRRLGRSGLKVSALSFGSWVTFANQVDTSNAVKIMGEAYDAGINFFDNAEVYAWGQSEIIMGEALKKLNWSRDTYVVSSKVYFGGVRNPLPNQRGLSRKHIVEACHQALQRLQVDYLDLYFCHRPDAQTPIEETVRAMHDLIQQGKVLYWGTSEWSAQEIMAAYSAAREFNLTPPTMEQPQYNMFVRGRFENEYERLYRDIGLGTTIWSPLFSGMLTGKYNDGIPNDSRLKLADYQWLLERFQNEEGVANLEKTRKLSKISDELGVSLTKMALAWCLKNENVSTVILGASKLSQLEENLESLKVVELLTDDVMAQVEEILQNKPEIVRW